MRLIILEGPDGSGKSTIAAAIAKRLGVLVDHHGPYLRESQITHHYLTSMQPVILSDNHVVMDRCWISEHIYGRVYREGLNRISMHDELMLNGIAAELHATFIICLPPLEVCLRNYRERKALEYLDNEDQLKYVWGMYSELTSFFGTDTTRAVEFNFTAETNESLFERIDI